MEPNMPNRISTGVRATLRVALCTALLVGAASAESLHDRIQHANGLLRSGETDKALDAYRNIQVDNPDSPVLDYNIGCAEYEKAMKALQSKEGKADTGALSEAIESFDRAVHSADPAVSESAAFNRANCFAQTAKNAEGAAQADRVKSFQEAIRAYEDVLKKDPGNGGAKQNIDHLRYMLKKTPPPPPPQEGGDDSEPKDDQSGDNKNKQQQQQSDPSGEQNPDSQPQQQDQQQQNSEEQSSQPDQPQDQQNQSENNSEQEQNSGAEQNPNEAKQDPGAPPPDQQSFEALLQSLENQDKEMQKDLRKGARAARVRSTGWW
jgi:Ca-activated chloride channel family protein